MSKDELNSAKRLITLGNEAAHEARFAPKVQFSQLRQHITILTGALKTDNISLYESLTKATGDGSQKRVPKATLTFVGEKPSPHKATSTGCTLAGCAFIFLCFIVITIWLLLKPDKVEPQIASEATIYAFSQEPDEDEIRIGADPNDPEEFEVAEIGIKLGDKLIVSKFFKIGDQTWLGGMLGNKGRAVWVPDALVKKLEPRITKIEFGEMLNGTQIFKPIKRRSFLSVGKRYGFKLTFENATPSFTKIIGLQKGTYSGQFCEKKAVTVEGIAYCGPDLRISGRFTYTFQIAGRETRDSDELIIHAIPRDFSNVHYSENAEPGFECDGILDRAKTLICSDLELAKLDNQMRSDAGLAKYVDGMTADRKKNIKHIIEVRWELYQNICSDQLDERHCLIKMYNEYIDEINLELYPSSNEIVYEQ